MRAIDTYGEFELPEEKSKIEVDESLVKKVEACGKFLVSYKITPDEIKKKLSEGHKDEVRMGFLAGKIDDQVIEIDDLFIPDQESNNCFTDIKPTEVLKEIIKIQKRSKQITGYAVYVNKSPPYETECSMMSRETLASQLGTPAMNLIINRRGEYKILISSK